MGERHNLMTKTHRPTQLQKATEFCNTIWGKADIEPTSRECLSLINSDMSGLFCCDATS
jgi:hypothetical protein